MTLGITISVIIVILTFVLYWSDYEDFFKF